MLSASWELDLWGRIRREDEAARANLLATEQARLGVALTLVSAVVSGYVTLLDLDRRLQFAEQTVTAAGRMSRFSRCDSTAAWFPISRCCRSRRSTKRAVATIPDLEQAIALQEHALSALVGRNPGPSSAETLCRRWRAAGAGRTTVRTYRQRPDILQSEQQLVAANALVGAARALYFPSLSLTGVGGSASNELDELFNGSSRTWSFIGHLLGPIFAGGAIDSANRQAEARREQALAAYGSTIQNAFRDVDDALAAIQATRDLVATLERRVAALERAVVLASERYDNGYADYLEVLDTERSLFSAELSLSTARGDGYSSLVDLTGRWGVTGSTRSRRFHLQGYCTRRWRKHRPRPVIPQ